MRFRNDYVTIYTFNDTVALSVLNKESLNINVFAAVILAYVKGRTITVSR